MNWKPIRKAAVAAAVTLCLAAAQLPYTAPAQAAAPTLDQIRVALILESGKLKSTIPAVTLFSAKGFNMSLTTAAGNTPIPEDTALATTIRAAADQYQVSLLETANFAQAKTIKDQVSAPGAAVSITTFTRSGKPVYQVLAGGYATKEAAVSAVAAFKLQPVLSVLSNNMTVRGPQRFNTGVYNTKADAQKALSSLLDKGLSAALALTEKTGGGFTYAVLLGAETDSQALQAYKLNALKVQSTLQLTAFDPSKPYVLLQDDLTQSADGKGAGTLLLFSAQGLKVAAAPKEGETRITEKTNRTYRGSVEVSLYNGKLAVINQVPFEQYLYSVVSGEMGLGWPPEALKAQAVAARTYALKSGTKYDIAHVSDSTLDQVYTGDEDADSVKAVDATAGEVLVDANGPIWTYFSANSGGMTSNGADVWGNTVSYLKVGPSPDDGAAKGKAVWRRGVLPSGNVAYIRSDYLLATGKQNAAGLPLYTITEAGVNARNAPYVDNANNPPVAKLNQGDLVVVFDEAQESNSYSWIRGPYTAGELLKDMNALLAKPVAGSLTSLEVSERGESGRAKTVTANGTPLQVSTPDAYRSLFGGLPSTRFEIERSGGYTIQGAAGASPVPGTSLYALSASGKAEAVDTSDYFVLSGDGKVDYATAATQFTFKGTGNGHGLGMSQWGARGWAEMGYDYKKILSYYYEGVTLTKE